MYWFGVYILEIDYTNELSATVLLPKIFTKLMIIEHCSVY